MDRPRQPATGARRGGGCGARSARRRLPACRFAALAGASLAPGALSEMADLGFLHQEEDQLRTTASGVMVLNGILRALLANRQSAG